MSYSKLFLLVATCAVFARASQAQDFLPEYARGTPMDEYLPPPPLQILGAAASEDEVEAIEELFAEFHEAWLAEDSEGLIATHAPDAQWTNAFGLVLRGHDEMRRFFPELFRNFDATTTGKARIISIRFVHDDIAIVQRYTQSAGGVMNREGGEGPRQIQVTNVLQKFDGDWKSIHTMIMDVRL